MKDFLSKIPAEVTTKMAEQVNDAVSRVEKKYNYHKRNEDQVSGALGEQLMDKVSGHIKVGDENIVWETAAHTVRSHGKGSFEKKYGADGFVEIRIKDAQSGELIAVKGMPFQAKKEGNEQGLKEQVQKMKSLACSGIVVEYGPNGFNAANESDVLKNDGSMRGLSQDQIKSLGKTLGEDFPQCRLGRVGAVYVDEIERIVDISEQEVKFLGQGPRQVITTIITRNASQHDVVTRYLNILVKKMIRPA